MQVNPFAYDDHRAPSEKFPTEDAYNTALLDACEQHNISILAVTDHWKASSGGALIAAAAARNIVALPGFEANCKEGFHLLVIVEAGTDIESITAAIGACGAPEDDPHGPGNRSFTDVVDELSCRRRSLRRQPVRRSRSGRRGSYAADVQPPLEASRSGHLDRPDGARLYCETSGNPDGRPALYLHGGPGSGLRAGGYRRRFDPDRYKIVGLDQRGCGRSTPWAMDNLASLGRQTTRELIADVEALREHLQIEAWLVHGVS